jgi:hypothetical protein
MALPFEWKGKPVEIRLNEGVMAKVKALACYITTCAGGRGAVREICEFILRAMDRWDALHHRGRPGPCIKWWKHGEVSYMLYGRGDEWMGG